MIGSRQVTAIAATVLLCSMVSAAWLTRAVDRLRPTAPLQEMLYISSPKLLKRLCLGYDGLLADIYWTRTVQYFGGTHSRGGGTYKLLWPLLNITTQLDPHLIPAYEFGETFLVAKPPQGAGDPGKAIELGRAGIQNNPDDWHLYYDLAFVYYDQKDYRDAAEAFLRGSQLPNTHPFLKIMAAQMAQHGGELNTARMMWSATLQTSHDALIRANAAAHLRAIQVDEDVTVLEQLVQKYRDRTGHFPARFSDMVSTGLIRGIPLDPRGQPYSLEAGGRVVVSDPEDLPFLDKGTPSGYVPHAAPKLFPAG
ncbi:MAG: tetratricopeptide repeat protein [Terriglobales bacterium]